MSNIDYLFKKTGKVWKIIFKGNDCGTFKNSGLAYFHHCMKHPQESFTNSELEAIIRPGLPVENTRAVDNDFDQIGTAGSIQSWQGKGDSKTFNNFKKRIKELQADIEHEKDPVIKKELETELEVCIKQVQDYSFKGKLKGFRNEDTRTSDRVNKNLDRALQVLRQADDEVYNHFHKAFKPIRSTSHTYKPTETLPWILD